MRCKIIRDDIEVAPEYASLPEWVPQIDRLEVFRNGSTVLRPFWKRGAILEHPEAYKLVRQGMAVPADEACAIRANRNPEQMAAAQKAYERLSRGIHPEDFDKYDAGMIEGYNADGSYRPGPNYHLLAEQTSDLILPDSYEDDEDDDS